MIEYNYSNGNLLETPQKYQKTSFHGKDFILSYSQTRKNIIETLEDGFLISEICSKTHNSINFELDSNFYLETLLLNLITNFNSDLPEINDFSKILIKKFEIKKKLFERYDNNFKETSSNFKHIRNYLLSSVLMILQYEKTFNLKYLNTLLKINDTINTQIPLFQNGDHRILHFILEKEVFFVTELCKKKGISL